MAGRRAVVCSRMRSAEGLRHTGQTGRRAPAARRGRIQWGAVVPQVEPQEARTEPPSVLTRFQGPTAHGRGAQGAAGDCCEARAAVARPGAAGEELSADSAGERLALAVEAGGEAVAVDGRANLVLEPALG